MRVAPAAFVRTTLPLNLSDLAELDTGRYHSIWLPDHMVSFWPDVLWTHVPGVRTWFSRTCEARRDRFRRACLPMIPASLHLGLL
jgi:hypothetical protein